ncbi:MAG TPA: pyridoxal phosphate-dependent aminotransferase family protein [Bacteroidales bacterium]|nr:pyridoxal phosphate-dependent aminotransferase family protein [Bacteroidales bacterium]HPS18416.1 pyridoxal phosphate-dependent aminotransferase family protein [Bacteroidales bacterium]
MFVEFKIVIHKSKIIKSKITLFSSEKYLNDALDKRRNNGSFRTLKVLHDMVDFCSNDYLGFSTTGELHARILDFNQKQPRQIVEGSTGSRLISGNSAVTESLEEFIASYHDAEAALIFNSGYDANVGLFSSVPKRGDTIFYDELVHASIRDGIRLSYAKAYSFRHNDVEHLKELFKLANGNVYVAVESVYSMDGDKAPIIEIAAFCDEKNANLIVDEAHATGVFGPQGKGCVAENILEKKVFARVHTYGKAMGTHGAVVAGSKILKDYLINFARSFIYTTALPLHSLIAIRCAYALLSESDEANQSLLKNIKFFRKIVYENEKINIIKSSSPIQSIIIPGNEKVVAVAKAIQVKGFDVRPILSPTVTAGKERLRICIHSFNNEEEIKTLTEIIEKFV